VNSSRPYFVRAVYEWLLDNQLTPYVLVDTRIDMVRVPQQYVEDNKIVLNIDPKAIAHLRMTNEAVEFDARFSGVSHHLFIPIRAISAVYAFENGRGMVFEEEDEDEFEPPTPPKPTTPEVSVGKKPSLKIVK